MYGVSGPAVVLLSTSPSYVGESTPSSEEISEDARTCRRAAAGFVAVDREREVLDGCAEAAWTDTADALLSVRGSLSSSEASYAGESRGKPCPWWAMLDGCLLAKERFEWRDRELEDFGAGMVVVVVVAGGSMADDCKQKIRDSAVATGGY